MVRGDKNGEAEAANTDDSKRIVLSIFSEVKCKGPRIGARKVLLKESLEFRGMELDFLDLLFEGVDAPECPSTASLGPYISMSYAFRARGSFSTALLYGDRRCAKSMTRTMEDKTRVPLPTSEFEIVCMLAGCRSVA